MNDLETAVAPWLVPLMRGEATALDADALASLSAWTFKTLLMIHEQAGAEDPVILDRTYKYLFEHREPPPGVQIWLAEHGASLQDQVTTAFSTIDRLALTTSSEPGMQVGEALYGGGLSLGRLIIIVFGSTLGSATPDRGSSPWLRRAWPNEEATNWPPPRSADERGGFWPFYGSVFPGAGP